MGSSDQKAYIQNTDEKGMSLFASVNLKRDEIIMPIYGLITHQPSTYTIPIGQGLYINPYPGDNLGKYLCHSCNPNAGIHGRNTLVAMRDIHAHEEINIDYAMIVDQFYVGAPGSKIACSCGSPNCRGKFVGYYDLTSLDKEKYKGYVSEYLICE